MKVTITAGNLGQGLQVVSRAVSSRTTLPILNNVLLQTADTGLQLRSASGKSFPPRSRKKEGSPYRPGC